MSTKKKLIVEIENVVSSDEEKAEKSRFIETIYRNIIDQINETLNQSKWNTHDMGTEIMLAALTVGWQVGSDNGYTVADITEIIKDFQSKNAELKEDISTISKKEAREMAQKELN